MKVGAVTPGAEKGYRPESIDQGTNAVKEKHEQHGTKGSVAECPNLTSQKIRSAEAHKRQPGKALRRLWRGACKPRKSIERNRNKGRRPEKKYSAKLLIALSFLSQAGVFERIGGNRRDEEDHVDEGGHEKEL